MSSPLAVASSEVLALFELQKLMLKAKHLYQQDGSSDSTLYSYKQQEDALGLGRLLIKCGVVKGSDQPQYVTQSDPALGPNRFSVLLKDRDITKIYSKIDRILRNLQEQEMVEHHQKELGNILLLQQLMREATKMQMYAADKKPSGMFYACNSKEIAVSLYRLLIDCRIFVEAEEDKNVAQHCRDLGERRFGVILQECHLTRVKKVTDIILNSEVGNSDLVGLLRTSSQKTRTNCGHVCYEFKDQKMALIVSRSLFEKYKIGKDAQHPKDVIQERGYFFITLTELEEKKIKQKIQTCCET